MVPFPDLRSLRATSTLDSSRAGLTTIWNDSHSFLAAATLTALDVPVGAGISCMILYAPSAHQRVASGDDETGYPNPPVAVWYGSTCCARSVKTEDNKTNSKIGLFIMWSI